MLQISEAWTTNYPGAVVGVLTMETVTNPSEHAGLEQMKTEFEAAVRAEYAGFTRPMLEALPAMQPYVAYYRRFNKSYHVLFQVESLVHKGKSLPRVAALVEAMFMNELKNQLLTAGHDLDRLSQPLKLDIARGDESYMLLNGQAQTLKSGDMFIADQEGIISSIIYGPDRRTSITAETQRVLFVVYAPPGIQADAVRRHLEDIRRCVEWVSPQAKTSLLEIYEA